jgi:hypothetical protein
MRNVAEAKDGPSTSSGQTGLVGIYEHRFDLEARLK